MVKVIWTDNAIQDLDNIGEYIARDSKRYAQITVERLFGYVEILETFPLSGKIVSEFENETIR